MTRKEIESQLKKFFKEHRLLTYLYCIGFVDTDADRLFITNDDNLLQNGKKHILMKAGGRVHSLFRQLEKEEEICFERTNKESRRKMYYFFFTDEDGNRYEPVFFNYDNIRYLERERFYPQGMW